MYLLFLIIEKYVVVFLCVQERCYFHSFIHSFIQFYFILFFIFYIAI